MHVHVYVLHWLKQPTAFSLFFWPRVLVEGSTWSGWRQETSGVGLSRNTSPLATSPMSVNTVLTHAVSLNFVYNQGDFCSFWASGACCLTAASLLGDWHGKHFAICREGSRQLKKMCPRNEGAFASLLQQVQNAFFHFYEPGFLLFFTSLVWFCTKDYWVTDERVLFLSLKRSAWLKQLLCA